MGSSALRAAWTSVIRHSGRPLMRAMVTNSSFSTSAWSSASGAAAGPADRAPASAPAAADARGSRAEDAAPFARIEGAGLVGAAAGQPAEPEGEDGEQDHADPEFRRRAGRERRRDDDALGQRAALRGEPGPGEDAEGVGQQQPRDRQDQRVGKRGEDDVPDRLPPEEGDPEISLRQIGEIDQVCS